jgi:hypothetical protein
MQGRRIGILAPSELAAEKALNLIWSAYRLLDAGPTWCEYRPVLKSATRSRLAVPNGVDFKNLGRITVSAHNFPLACMIAAKASRRREFVYALAKYTLSASIHANDIVDLDPRHGEHMRLSPFPEDHVRFAYSIVTAYSVIEQLGLEVRASQKRPSMIKGEWNPLVKMDLEERLRHRGIDLAEQINWNVRGSVRRIERERPPRSQGKPTWVRYNVRDCYVNLIDAIADLSWLRSRVAAHRMGELAKVLSPYDVANGQQLARRLLLEALGFWHYWGRRKGNSRTGRKTC